MTETQTPFAREVERVERRTRAIQQRQAARVSTEVLLAEVARRLTDPGPLDGPFAFCCHCGDPKEANRNYVCDCGQVGDRFAFCGKCGLGKEHDVNRVHVECLAPGSSPWRSR